MEVNSFVHGFDGILSIREWWVGVHMSELLLKACEMCLEKWRRLEGSVYLNRK